MRNTIARWSLLVASMTVGSIANATSSFHIDTTHPVGDVRHEVYGGNVEFIGSESAQMQDVLVGMPIARFPGGDDTSGFLWSDTTTGTCSEPRWNWDGVAAFAAGHGMSMLLESNVVRGNAASTAAWVHDAVSRGIRVPYLDVGNEVWGNWDAGYRTPAQYADDVHATAAAVRAVSPSTRIVLEIGTFNEESWNREAIRLTADVIDAVDYHYYPNHLSNPDALSVAAGAEGIAPLIARIRAMIQDEAPARADAIEILVGEWDGAQDPPSGGGALTSGHAYLQWSMPNALFYGSAIGEMLHAGVSAATYYELQGHRFGAINGGACASYDVRVRRPKELALRLYRDHFGDRLLDVVASAVPSYTSAGPTNWDGFAGTAPYVRAYASLGAAGDTLHLIIVNRDPANTLPTQWSVDGFNPAPSADAWQLAGDSMLATNENVGGPSDAVHITTTNIAIAGSNFEFDAPPHSVTALVLHRQAVTPMADASTGPANGADASTDVPTSVENDAGPPVEAHDAGMTLTTDASVAVARDGASLADGGSSAITVGDTGHDAAIIGQNPPQGCACNTSSPRGARPFGSLATLGLAAIATALWRLGRGRTQRAAITRR